MKPITLVYLVALKTIVTHEIRRFLRIWQQTLVPPAINATLYFLIFGSIIGSRVGQMQNLDYIAYIAPGLILMSAITNAYSNVSSSFFSMKFMGSIEEILAAPVPNYIILLGFCMGGVVRGMLSGILVYVTSYIFIDLTIIHLPVVIATLILTTLIFSLGGLINGIYARSFDDISIVPTFILTPLIYVGGVFYSIDILPEFWADVSKLNPIVYLMSLFRYGFFNITGHVDIWHSLLFVIIVFSVLWVWTIYLLTHSKYLRK